MSTAADLAAEASDPATAPVRLAALANDVPWLRPLIAENPAVYPGLRDWLAALHDPAVDAALGRAAARDAVPPPQPMAPAAEPRPVVTDPTLGPTSAAPGPQTRRRRALLIALSVVAAVVVIVAVVVLVRSLNTRTLFSAAEARSALVTVKDGASLPFAHGGVPLAPTDGSGIARYRANGLPDASDAQAEPARCDRFAAVQLGGLLADSSTDPVALYYRRNAGTQAIRRFPTPGAASSWMSSIETDLGECTTFTRPALDPTTGLFITATVRARSIGNPSIDTLESVVGSSGVVLVRRGNLVNAMVFALGSGTASSQADRRVGDVAGLVRTGLNRL